MSARQKWLRRIRRIALLAGMVLAVVLVVANTALNTVLKKSAERVLSAKFGHPVSLGRVSYWPLTGIHAREVRLGEEGGAGLTMGISADLHHWPSLRSWFTERTLVFGEIVCHEPRLALELPDATGQNVPPQPINATPQLADRRPPEVNPDDGAKPSVGSSAAPSNDRVTAEPPGKARVAPPAPAARGQPMRIEFARLTSTGGSLVMRDPADGAEVASAAGFEFAFEPVEDSGVIVAGQADFGELQVGGEVLSKGGTARVVVKPGGIELREISIPIPGGEVTGRANLESAAGNPFRAEFHAPSLALPELLAELVGDLPFELLEGNAKAALRIGGKASDPRTARARLKFEARDMALRRGEELASGTATLDLVGRNLLVTEASVRSGARWIRAAGRVVPDGTLQLNARLYAGGDLHHSFVRRVTKMRETPTALAFAHLPGTDWRFLDFRVAGGLAQPRADLWGDGQWVDLEQLLDAFLAKPELLAVVGDDPSS